MRSPTCRTSDTAVDAATDVAAFDVAHDALNDEAAIVDAHVADALNCTGSATFDFPSRQMAEQICHPPSCKVCVQEVDSNSIPTLCGRLDDPIAVPVPSARRESSRPLTRPQPTMRSVRVLLLPLGSVGSTASSSSTPGQTPTSSFIVASQSSMASVRASTRARMRSSCRMCRSPRPPSRRHSRSAERPDRSGGAAAFAVVSECRCRNRNHTRDGLGSCRKARVDRTKCRTRTYRSTRT